MKTITARRRAMKPPMKEDEQAGRRERGSAELVAQLV
jgi:hypothetical protein